MKLFYDIIPPKEIRKEMEKMEKKTLAFGQIFKRIALKAVCLLVIISLNWLGLSAVIETFAYMNDTESSPENTFTAGTLDFELNSPNDFSPPTLAPGESATRDITFLNNGNIPKYKVSATDFSGLLCKYLNLKASLDEGGILYSDSLTSFTYGPVVFETPENWHFTLTLPSNAPEEVGGQTCQFKFVFFGSQTKNDLPFGEGFNDTEEIANNISAKVCRDVEIRSMGYWKNHENVYITYLPQYLGGYPTDETIDSVPKVNGIFDADNSVMRNKLKKQLLAMKFNLAHFGIGGYIPEGDTRTLDQIVADADNLLRNPDATNDELEAMKNLLDWLNNLGQIRYCYVSLPEVRVLVPNGEEVWWIGHYYDITWTTNNLNCPNDNSEVSIWYSRDSGETWANIIQSTENDGVYNWRAPLTIDGYYVPSSHARIKIVARCTENQMVVGWDMSDADFCPPIDYSLLTPEEIKMLIDYNLLTLEGKEILENLGLMPQESSPETPPAGEDFNNPPDESIPTEGTETTESIPAIETTTPEEDGLIFNETSENTNNAESPVEESIPEENQEGTQQETIDGTTVNEQQPAIIEDENSIIEQIEESNANPNENPENPTPETSQTENNQTESGSPETIPAEENLSSPNG